MFLGKLKQIIIAGVLVLAASAQGANVSEYALKAAYLSNFTESVKWPKSAFAEEAAPLVMGVLGDDPFGSTLDDEVKGKSVSGHPVVVKRYGGFDKVQKEELLQCHLLFIANSEQDKIREILASLKGSPLLTVSEIDQFPGVGGMIQFVQEGDRIGLVINPKTAIGVKLRLSSQLMMSSKISMDVDRAKLKSLYYEGIQLYINGEIKAAIKKWKECLKEDPSDIAAQNQISKAKDKLRAISNIR